MEQVLNYMPSKIREEMSFYNNELIEEIRPIAIKCENQIKLSKHITVVEEMLQTFEKICENSVYTYKKQICEGFITIKGGHRVGITGNCVFENGQVQNINYISS